MTPVWVTVTCASNSCYLKKLKMYETPSFHPGKTLRSLKKWLRAQTSLRHSCLWWVYANLWAQTYIPWLSCFSLSISALSNSNSFTLAACADKESDKKKKKK